MSTKSNFSLYTPAELRKLYQDNPSLFDEMADEAIKQACSASTPEKTLKLQQLQWTIDMQLRRAKNPTARMQVMENIFYGKIYGEQGQLAKLTANCNKLIRAVTGHIPETDSEGGSGKKREVL